MIGAGAVGGAIISQIVAENLPFAVVSVAVKELGRARKFLSLSVKTTSNALSIANDETIEVLIDVSRDFDTKDIIDAAKASGKTIISVNKDFYAGQEYTSLPLDDLQHNANLAAIAIVDQLNSIFNLEES